MMSTLLMSVLFGILFFPLSLARLTAQVERQSILVGCARIRLLGEAGATTLTVGRGALGDFAACVLRAQPFVHQRDEATEELIDVVRTGARLRMPLETEGRTIGTFDPLQRAVE